MNINNGWKKLFQCLKFILIVIVGVSCLGDSAHKKVIEVSELPGQLVVQDGNKFYEYTNGLGFTPVEGFKDQADYINHDPTVSPDGTWYIDYDESIKRFVVSNGQEVIPFTYWSFALSQIAWSPDSRFIAYRADDHEAEWTGRIMIMSLENGETQWIGEGESPRWFETP